MIFLNPAGSSAPMSCIHVRTSYLQNYSTSCTLEVKCLAYSLWGVSDFFPPLSSANSHTSPDRMRNYGRNLNSRPPQKLNNSEHNLCLDAQHRPTHANIQLQEKRQCCYSSSLCFLTHPHPEPLNTCPKLLLCAGVTRGLGWNQYDPPRDAHRRSVAQPGVPSWKPPGQSTPSTAAFCSSSFTVSRRRLERHG